jgi:competence protein ComEA
VRELPALFSAWPRSAQLATAFLLGLCTCLLILHIYGSLRWSSRPSELERGAYRIDVNRANRAELLQLPGVGENLAQRIEDYRREHGPFRTVNSLQEVRGIGPMTLERLRPWVRAEGKADEVRSSIEPDDRAPASKKASTATKEQNGRKSVSKKEASLSAPVDINRATTTELQRLPGIGPKLSQRIVDERQRRSFESVDDLRRVSGIGEKTLQRLRPYITVHSAEERVVATNDDGDNRAEGR